MTGGKNKQPRNFGYTIVEVLVFLAVSGFMFTLAVVFVSDKQANAEYHQGMNDINSQIHTVINDVANGYYPSSEDFTCTVVGATAAPTIAKLPIGSQEAGTNTDCVFMGKVMQFNVQGSDRRGYNVYSVTGRRYAINSTDSSPLSFLEAKPTAVDTGSTVTDVNITDHRTLQWGLELTGMYKVTYAAGVASYVPIGSVGFFGNFGNVSGGVLQSGAQSVIVADVPGALGESETDTVAHISAITSIYTADTSVLLCFDDGKGHLGSITIGGSNGQQLQTTLKMGGVGAPC